MRKRTEMPDAKELRALRIAARDGDCAAGKALLRLFGYDDLAKELKPGKVVSKRVRVAIGALAAGVGTKWEDLLILPDPPADRKPLSRLVFDDDSEE